MKNIKSRTTATAIALFLMLTITATMTVLPIVSAHDPPWTIKTYAFVTASPNPVGVGEYTTIVFWVDENPPTAGGMEGQWWTNCKLDITKPDGSKETIGGITIRSATGNYWQQYTPDQVGTYTITFTMPDQIATNGTWGDPKSAGIPFVGDLFKGSTSDPIKLVVQQEPIPVWQEPPLPTQYWQRPIHDANRGWSTLASNWLKGSWLVSNYQRWGTAPESPHILWTQPITPGYPGGISDAQWPGQPTDVSDYENPWSSPIIMEGKIYYNQPPVSDVASYGYYCRDLYTGELVWYKNGTDNGLNNPYTVGGSYNLGQSYPGLTQGWLYHYTSVNGQGILAYLIMAQGSTWYILDASTGNLRLTLKNVPSGYAVTDQDGSLLYYSYNATNGNLLCWNITQSIPPLGPSGTNQQQWKARFGATIDAVNDTTWWNVGPSGVVVADDIRPRSGYTMNVTIQKGLPLSWSPGIQVLTDPNRVPKMVFGSWIELIGLATSGAEYHGMRTSGAGEHFSAWVVQLNEHATEYSPYPNRTNTQNNNLGWGATLLWYKNYTVPITGMNYTWELGGSGGYEGQGGVSYDDQVFILICKQLRQMWGYSLKTGELLWGPTPAEAIMDYYGMTNGMTYYGKMLSCGYAGTLYAYDAKTGKLVWTYNATSVGRESPYGENYPLSITAVADGKVYLHSSEHSPTKPLWRGSYLRCINITDGTEIWKLLDFNLGASIADGLIVTASLYDNNIYCIGKGPSAVTATASPKVSVNGDSVLIEGTVTDISPGTKQLTQTALFPSGVPAVADADMEAWMEYLYEQQAMPTNAKGVEVTLDTVDPNGNFIHIGTVTTDMSGGFSYMWTPEVPGKYTVIATFAGSKSYYASYAQTYLGVSEAPPATPPPQYPVPADYTPTIIAAAIAIIIAVAIVGMLILRKRQ